MRVEQCMKTDVISIGLDHTVQQAAGVMVAKHIGTLPVVDAGGRLIGLLTIGDVLSLFMPDFVRLLDQIDFVPDFGTLEERELPADVAGRATRLVMRSPVSIARGSGLLRAFVEINRHNLLDLPVVDEVGKLIGIVSRVDLGTAFLSRRLAASGMPDARV